MECRFVDPDSFLILLYIYMYMLLFRMILFSNTRTLWLLCTVCSRICVFCLTLHSVWLHIRAACINVRLCVCVSVHCCLHSYVFFKLIFFVHLLWWCLIHGFHVVRFIRSNRSSSLLSLSSSQLQSLFILCFVSLYVFLRAVVSTMRIKKDE